MSDWIPIAIKFKGKCSECGKEIPQGEKVLWLRGKAIKHVKCPSAENEKKMPVVQELECFICGKPAGCAMCGFEMDCDRQMVSQACICSNCLEDEEAFANYQRTFIENVRRVAKVKI